MVNDNYDNFRSFVNQNCSSKGESGTKFSVIEGSDGCIRMKDCLEGLKNNFPNTIKNDIQGAQTTVETIMKVASEKNSTVDKAVMCVIRNVKPSDCSSVNPKTQVFGLQLAPAEITKKYIPVTVWKDCAGILEGKKEVFLNLKKPKVKRVL